MRSGWMNLFVCLSLLSGVLSACTPDGVDKPLDWSDTALFRDDDSGPFDSGMPDSGMRDSGLDDTGEGDTGEGDTGEDTPATPQVCYPGATYAWDVCFDLVDYSVDWGEGYDYPAPYMGSTQYIAPSRFIDLSLVDPSIALAPNFNVGEVMQVERGQYGLFQVHALEFLQQMRDRVGGPISVSSAYRNVTYNASLPASATHSRHMYGDAVDIVSGVISIDGLEDICIAESGYLVEYESHVHCDWRSQPLDTSFYDVDGAASGPPMSMFSASLTLAEDGAWQAPAEGFDEGEPRRLWSALDASGHVLARGDGRRFEAPEGTAEVIVRVGRQVAISQRID
jgi:hypothetical protein